MTEEKAKELLKKYGEQTQKSVPTLYGAIPIDAWVLVPSELVALAKEAGEVKGELTENAVELALVLIATEGRYESKQDWAVAILKKLGEAKK